MTVSRLDILYKKRMSAKFFCKGWGDPEHVMRMLSFRKIMAERETCFKLVNRNHPIEISKVTENSDCVVTEGKFVTPLAEHLPEVIQDEIRNCYFQMVVPKVWKNEFKPMCIHLAGTGDHYFWKRRQVLVKPLLKEGIASVIVENPFYGLRKPKEQFKSFLLNVSDIFVMGGCLILECLVLLHFCERLGFGPLGITGLSMGGHNASLAATSWPKPLVLVPCLSWSTASTVFTEGVISDGIDWDFLQNQYSSNETFHQVISKLCEIVDEPCEFGLAKIPEFSIQKINIKRLTPHKLLNMIGECPKPKPKPNYASILKSFFKEDTISTKLRDKDAVWFMRGLMDECTHLKNYDTPVDTSLIIAICAKSDAYVPRDGCSRLEDIWPEATIRYLECGHVEAYIRHITLYRKSILEAFEKAKKITVPNPAAQPITQPKTNTQTKTQTKTEPLTQPI